MGARLFDSIFVKLFLDFLLLFIPLCHHYFLVPNECELIPDRIQLYQVKPEQGAEEKIVQRFL